MRGIRTYSFVVAFLAFGFLLLALPEDGFSGLGPAPQYCCQGEGTCADSSEGPILCRVEDVVQNAFCNQETGECALLDTSSNIPTLSEWGLIAMAGVLGIAGYVIIRRRKATA